MLIGESWLRMRRWLPLRDSETRTNAVRAIVAGATPSSHDMAVRHPEGLFQVAVDGVTTLVPYRFEVTWRDSGDVTIVEDPYRFGLLMGDLDLYLIGEGRHQQLHRVLGAHPTVIEASGAQERNITNDPDPDDDAPNWSPVAMSGLFRTTRRLERNCGVRKVMVRTPLGRRWRATV
jgi:1,4-alpha-glucan branching enzyme